ncbi:restriction endonuclease subunit S [Pseudomonas sp. S3E17]|uniref:restriction endonuclease subunit S n=1 Tax=Pseudomonas sp. S3E17 TaxID=2817893 RepID=UPI0020A01B5F|nr:restriction endonuclease subunit S [Pseudomonas sp. S3E17]MCP1465854.1 type I restriction enzyme S subunit [Pseudomonas sp. S3E17]
MKMIPLSQAVQINPRLPKGFEDSREISFIPMASVSENGGITHQETRNFGEVKKGFTYFQRGDVLLAKITPCFENGKSALTDNLERPIGFGSTEFHVIRSIPGKSDSRFLYHLVRSNKLMFLGQKSMKGAAGHKRVPADFLEDFEFPDWSTDEQIRIAHLLSKVEGLVAQRRQHLQQLDELLKSVFLEFFGDPVLNPHQFPIKRLSKFYVDSKDGTKCGPFGSALKKEELVDSGVPVWNMDNITADGQMLLPFRMWITEEKYKDLSAYSVRDGDIIISRAGTVGKMCVARMNGQPAVISTNLIRLRLGAELRPHYFVSLMLYCKGRVGRLKTGADGAFTHMNTGVLDSLEFPYPSVELQDQFGKIASKVEGVISRYQQSLCDLECLYGALSQQAFNGELDLSRMPMPDSQLEEEIAVVAETSHPRAGQDLGINLPAPTNLLDALENSERRTALISQWLEAYRGQLGETPFSAQHFMAAAQNRLEELDPDNDVKLGINDFEHIKTWVFEALAAGKLMQALNDARNRIELKAVHV